MTKKELEEALEKKDALLEEMATVLFSLSTELAAYRAGMHFEWQSQEAKTIH